MSADNCLVAIPAKNGALALYDIPRFCGVLDDDLPQHEACRQIAVEYARNRVGVYENRTLMEQAAEHYMQTAVVEYGLFDLSEPQQPRNTGRPPRP